MRARPLIRRAVHAAWVAAAAAFLAASFGFGPLRPARAQTGDGWEQYQRDAARSGVTIDGQVPPYRVTWETEVDLGAPSDVSGFPVPIVVGDLAVVVAPESVVAIDVTDGSQAWSVERALGPSVPAAAAETPDGTVIVVTEGGGEGDASATPTTPTAATPSATPSTGVPPVDLDTASVLLGLDAETGERLWEDPLPALSRTGAAVIGSRAFVGTDEGDVIAVDVVTGEERWSAEAGDEVRLPVAANGDLVLVPTTPSDSSGSSDLVALGVDDGEEAWRFTPPIAGSIVGSPAIGPDAAFVALSDQTVVSLDLEAGKVSWSASTGYPGGFTPAVFGDLVVAIDGRGQVYALDIADGERRWDFALNLNIFGPPVAGPPIGVERYLLVPGDAGAIEVLDVDAGELVFDLSVSDGVVLGVAATADHVVATTTGGSPGLVGVAHDADGTLTSIPSPTVPDLPLLVGAWALAAVPAAVILWLLGRMLWARLGPLDLPEGADGADEGVDEGETEA